MATRKRRPRLPGLDPVYVLAVRPGHKGERPTRFLTDSRLFPGEGDTSMPVKARRWADSSGPRHYLLSHPKLRKKYVSWKIFDPVVLVSGETVMFDGQLLKIDTPNRG